MPRKTQGTTPAPTTSQSLGALLKSARDIMRKDKGLNGDLDRLPLLTWIMFLKFLDDLETQREMGATLAGRKFRPAIDPPYRWRDWAANPQGVTGDELLAFINQDETTRPDGTRGAGLFAHLRGLTSANGDDKRDVIATVFKGVDNRMRSGYLLRDVVNRVGGIHFTANEELHTLGALYESMLREMRDAAGDSGEFYTPRPVVRFMVEVTDPRLGETVLDPASGTGGFLVEAFNYLSRQVKTVEERRTLQDRSLVGCEPKSLPYLLCQMNLLLHGLDAPRIDPNNALRLKLSEIGEKDRVDVILTNPPFGGEEEKGIQGNFPEDRQTAETALLFLQLIMRKLRRQPTAAKRPARAAVVVPNGTLFGDGVCARIKEELLKDFNLVTNDFPLFNVAQERLVPGFLAWLCRTSDFVELCLRASEGTTNRVRLKEERFLALELPLPPLAEQQRIVARIEHLTVQIAEARSLRRQAAEEAQAFLTAARRAVISNCEGQNVALEDVCAAVIDNLHSNPILAESGVPCVRSPDVGWGTLNLDRAQRTDEEEYRRRTVRGEPQADDLVLVREGGGTGKCAVMLPGQRFSLGQRVMMLRPNPAKILPRFFLHQLLSPLVQEQQIGPMTKGSASPHLNIAALKRFTIRLPDLLEQRRLVSHLDELQWRVEQLRLLQDDTARELDAFMPAILDRAFKGEL